MLLAQDATRRISSRGRAVFGIRFSPGGMADLLEELKQLPERREASSVVTANVDHIVNLMDDEAFQQAYRNAWRVTADGMPVYLYARMRGAGITERVAGSDTVVRFFEGDLSPRFRFFFAAASQATADAITARLVSRGVPRGSIATMVPPFGFERDDDYTSQLTARIAAHGTTHLFMGVGAPKSEIWVDRHRRELGRCYALCVGAGLDYLAGTRRRAPEFVQKLGFEWLWRLGLEPKRLARRYLVGAFLFLRAIVRDVRGDV